MIGNYAPPQLPSDTTSCPVPLKCPYSQNYDPLVKGKYLDEVRYDEPLSETGPMSPQFLREVAPLSPKYHRIESDYEPSVAPLFSSR